MALRQERYSELKLLRKVNNNTSQNRTNFTVSVELLTKRCTTGISAPDRAKTVKDLAGLKPVGALVEITNTEGEMARYPDLVILPW